jgi:hypothetical protein
VKLALLALFALTVPVPFTEAFSAEEEVILLASKSAARPVRKESATPSPAPVPRPAPRRIVTDLPTRSLIDWTPAVFTRPPPRT